MSQHRSQGSGGARATPGSSSSQEQGQEWQGWGWEPGFGVLWTPSGQPSDLGMKVAEVDCCRRRSLCPLPLQLATLLLLGEGLSPPRARPGRQVLGGKPGRPSQPRLPLSPRLYPPGTGLTRDLGVHVFCLYFHFHSPFLEISSENKDGFFQDCLPT